MFYFLNQLSLEKRFRIRKKSTFIDPTVFSESVSPNEQYCNTVTKIKPCKHLL